MQAEYIGRSIFESSFIYCKGGRLLSVQGTPGRSRFVWDDKDQHARRIAAEYVADGAAPAKSLFEAFHQLKREADQALGKIRYASDGAMQ